MKKKGIIGLFTGGVVVAGLVAANVIPVLAAEENTSTTEGIDTLQVVIDVKPGNDVNPINNNGKGIIKVAILGSEDFDVNDIDLSTISLEEMGIKEPGKSGKLLAHIGDVNGDGFDDLTVMIQDVEGKLDNTSATLTGELYDGTPIEGTDAIHLVPDNQS